MLVTFPDPDDCLGPSKGFGSSTCFFMLTFRIYGIFLWGWLGIPKIKQIDDTNWHIIIFRLNIAIFGVFFPKSCDILMRSWSTWSRWNFIGTATWPTRPWRTLAWWQTGGTWNRPGKSWMQPALRWEHLHWWSMGIPFAWACWVICRRGSKKTHIWKHMFVWTNNS